jgi:23S rRNA maturation-related 3'-5' exoribonuclease YhaM
MDRIAAKERDLNVIKQHLENIGRHRDLCGNAALAKQNRPEFKSKVSVILMSKNGTVIQRITIAPIASSKDVYYTVDGAAADDHRPARRLRLYTALNRLTQSAMDKKVERIKANEDRGLRTTARFIL